MNMNMPNTVGIAMRTRKIMKTITYQIIVLLLLTIVMGLDVGKTVKIWHKLI
jgi:hypothetical protein